MAGTATLTTLASRGPVIDARTVAVIRAIPVPLRSVTSDASGASARAAVPLRPTVVTHALAGAW
jgi:hypothetical protein